MKTCRTNGTKITNWKTFHNEFKKQMNFPDYYGENMNAWMDCVDELSDAPTIIEITKGHLLKERAPEQLEAIFECSAFVNYRKIEQGKHPTLMISTQLY
ncbi:barstar family protein [Marinoscillum pacificum]|uniref:barstar family protein n=1 Tax=Marinoscillum pacificum TaxID=392723 RepID=UPI0021573226|nr:barstar family protein [Marinoscillum pacificum]